ncbi:hypothetical protein HYC85_022751 [Camellia sinensis]|uniref:Uncharacterized protein n=1 Tax=Camellia sinensis TaxID=4442 RepID=A0A7J7GCM3_CAMSI|nr:hypothetical protein HYC85_022751 [Camellia sinensis]
MVRIGEAHVGGPSNRPIISNFGEMTGLGPIGVAAQSLIGNGSGPLSGLVGNIDIEGIDIY